MSAKNRVREFYNGCTRPREGEEEYAKNRFVKLIYFWLCGFEDTFALVLVYFRDLSPCEMGYKFVSMT